MLNKKRNRIDKSKNSKIVDSEKSKNKINNPIPYSFLGRCSLKYDIKEDYQYQVWICSIIETDDVLPIINLNEITNIDISTDFLESIVSKVKDTLSKSRDNINSSGVDINQQSKNKIEVKIL